MKIEILNRSGEVLPRRLLKRDLGRAIQMLEGAKSFRAVTIVSVRANESRKLKQRFFKKNSPANVLSFHYGDYAEVIVTPAVIRAEAVREGASFRTMLRRMLVHGLVHLAGYDHEGARAHAVKFERREAQVLSKLGIDL